MSSSEIILYQTEDGLAKVSLKAIEGTVWLIQEEIADLFGKGRSTIAEHIQNILNDEELVENLVCRNFRRTANDSKDYNTLHYNLDMILAVGYRVRSSRGIQFRRWANTVLKEYLVKGFAMNDERLKQADQWDYFDEWLARIRDIRASEKRFYQKIKGNCSPAKNCGNLQIGCWAISYVFSFLMYIVFSRRLFYRPMNT